jgi:septal ring-binding cell division protein DamX
LPEPHPDRSPERRAAAPPAPMKASPDRRAKKGEPAGSAAPAKNESWEALARAGRKAFEHPGAHRYAIQLELACEGSTLEKAFAADPGRRQIWIAPYPFRGRSCYRVLWGKYRDLDSAKAAKSAVPEMFSHDGNHPAVVSLGRAK